MHTTIETTKAVPSSHATAHGSFATMFKASAVSLVLAASMTVPLTSFAAGRVFYDGFESGDTNLWQKDSYRNTCSVVSSAVDGGAPAVGSRMLQCNWNGTVPWNDPRAYESLVLPTWSYSKEFLVRARFRVDRDATDYPVYGPKWFRIGADGESYCAMSTRPGTNCVFYSSGTRQIGSTYWGSDANPFWDARWHKFELYVKQDGSSGVVKVWIDGAKVWEASGITTPGDGSWARFWISSNWQTDGVHDRHDANNHVYWDEFEILSDTGAGSTGWLSDATASSGSSQQAASPAPAPGVLAAPTNVRVLAQ